MRYSPSEASCVRSSREGVLVLRCRGTRQRVAPRWCGAEDSVLGFRLFGPSFRLCAPRLSNDKEHVLIVSWWYLREIDSRNRNLHQLHSVLFCSHVVLVRSTAVFVLVHSAIVVKRTTYLVLCGFALLLRCDRASIVTRMNAAQWA